jgi:iron complex transport system ATP-binding protein
MCNWTCLEDVTLIRQQRRILDQISWKIEPGQHWVVLGANGSGKTTLLQLLAGYFWPSRGSITVLGEQFGRTDLRELRKKIGWVGSFLQVQIPPRQRAMDFIVSGKFASIGIFESPSTEDYAAAEEVAERLDCREILETPYCVLSQGEKQRALIARALIHRPELLILDEPCAGLDLVAREQLLQRLEELGRNNGGPTMIFVTHHLEEIMPVWSHVLLLKKGRCLAQGEKPRMLASDLLSETFDLPILLDTDGIRYWARMSGFASATAKAE